MSDLVVLCYSRNTPYSYDAHTPLSILCLGTFLEINEVKVEYFDERVHDRARLEELLGRRPRVVGFSVIGGYQIASSSRLAERVRQRSPESFIVWGGIAPTALPELVLKEPFVDCVAMGEAEETLLELTRALRAPHPCLREISGIAFKEDGRVVVNARRPPLAIEDLPFVYQGKARELLATYLKQASIRESVGFEASRGCPFTCSFCYSPNFNGAPRVKSPKKIAFELGQLKALGVDDLDVYDDTFLGGRLPDIERWTELLKPLAMRWIINWRINMLSERLLRTLEASGCKWLYFGIESDDDSMLKTMQKGLASSQIANGIDLMDSSSLPVVYSLIADPPVPGGHEHVWRCLEFAEQIHARQPRAEIQIQSYVPLPGSELYKEAVRLGFEPYTRLAEWSEHDHFHTRNPWARDPLLGGRVYISSMLAYRYRRHFSHFPVNLVAYPLHLFSRWRIRRRNFSVFFEKPAYDMVLAAARLWVAMRFRLRELLSWAAAPRPRR